MFERAVTAGGSAVAVVILILFVTAAPTSDIRARIPFLVLLTPIALAATWLILSVIAFVAACVAAGVSRESIAGAAVAGVVGVGFILSGFATKAIPQVRSETVGWAVSMLALSALVLLIVRLRARGAG